MNYFTPAWHRSGCEDDWVFDRYREYLTPLLPRLPPEVQTLATRLSLHDGLLWRAVADTEQATLSLSLRCGDLRVGYFDLELLYLEVLFSPSLLGELAGLVAVPSPEDLHYPSRHSEALYDEVDIDEEMLVHRILFTSRDAYQEVAVRFRQLRLRTTPRAGRYDIDGIGAAS